LLLGIDKATRNGTGLNDYGAKAVERDKTAAKPQRKEFLGSGGGDEEEEEKIKRLGRRGIMTSVYFFLQYSTFFCEYFSSLWRSSVAQSATFLTDIREVSGPILA
jgi:hypothetical protein